MTNKEFLKRASKLQKEFAEIYDHAKSGLKGINADYIQVFSHKFHELESKEGLLQHISKTLNGIKDMWNYEAMTLDGVKIIAVEFVDNMDER